MSDSSQASDDCERFVQSMLDLARPRPFLWRWRLGFILVFKEVRNYLGRRPSKHIPTLGFREELVAFGQRGEVYRHLRFHIGCELLGWPGVFLSRQAAKLDLRQLNDGRLESATELIDNQAGRWSGQVLVEYLGHRISRSEARINLLELLHDDP